MNMGCTATVVHDSQGTRHIFTAVPCRQAADPGDVIAKQYYAAHWTFLGFKCPRCKTVFFVADLLDLRQWHLRNVTRCIIVTGG